MGYCGSVEVSKSDRDSIPRCTWNFTRISILIQAYSITDRKTFENVEQWMADVRNHAPANTIVAVVGNKVN